MKAFLLMAACAGVLTLALVAPRAQTRDELRAFTGARVFDGTGRPPIDDATILVRGGRIAEVGASAAVAVPAGAARTALAGKTIIPGLVNAHGHVGKQFGWHRSSVARCGRSDKADLTG